METFSLTTIFWLIVLGITTGWILGYSVGHEGINLASNMIWGTIGAVGVGSIAIVLNIGGVLLYSFMGTMAMLYLANVFHLHHEDDILGDVDHGMRIKR